MGRSARFNVRTGAVDNKRMERRRSNGSVDSTVLASLETVPFPSVALGPDGRIVAVNAAWREAAVQRGANPERCGVGVDYLAVCDSSTGDFRAGASAAARGIRRVLDGTTETFSLDYPCPAGGVEQWFSMRVVTAAPAAGAIISHLDVTELKLAELSVRSGLTPVGSTTVSGKRWGLVAELEFQALYDPLTKLPNRRLFMRSLERAWREDYSEDGQLAVMFLDLDDFTAVNERLGHAAGDAALQQVAGRVSEILRPTDTVGRLGGDEFVICCRELPRVESALALAGRVREVIGAPMEIAGRTVMISATIGLAVSAPGSGSGAEQMLREADAAMYSAKRSGRAQIALFDEALRERDQRRRDLVERLEVALRHGDVRPYYQPQIDLRTRELAGFEALARWTDPTRGPISPIEFIPAAEQHGLIGRLGHQILRATCAALATWPHCRPGRLPQVSLNASIHQLRDPSFPQQVAAAIAEADVPADRICIEVTESLLEDEAVAAQALRALKAVGVEIALDDFGTGYSSLSRLHRFPLDYLKIDRSFVSAMSDPDGMTVVAAVLDLAHRLGLTTIAEGIETDSQLKTLTEMGWDMGQGYLWSAAVPEDEARRLTTTSPWDRYGSRTAAPAVPGHGRR